MNHQSIIAEIAAQLDETQPQVLAQLGRLVKVLGPEASRALVAEAEQIEADGGMMTKDGSRRRTKGGVYFQVARTRLVAGDRRFVFPMSSRQKPQQSTPASAPAPAPAPALSWEDRGALIKEAQPGKATQVKMTIIGRPDRVVERDGFTLALLTHTGPLPSLPKGIPTPSKVPETKYIVYISAKQWRGVKNALANPDDALIAEGTPIYDPEYKAIAVFVTNATTKQLQAAKRQPNPEQKKS